MLHNIMPAYATIMVICILDTQWPETAHKWIFFVPTNFVVFLTPYKKELEKFENLENLGKKIHIYIVKI
jgi:hypothetical protein